MRAVDGWKVCSACGEKKPVCEYYPSKSQCKGCCSKNNKKYHQTHVDKQNEYHKRFRTNNKDIVKEYSHKAYVLLTPSCIADLLGIPVKDAPLELIEAKRQQVLLTRAIRASKKGINNV